MKVNLLSKKILGTFLATLICCSTALAAEPAEGVQILKYDRPANMSYLPDNFRTAQSIYKSADKNVPSREGLDKLRLSGSSFFAKKDKTKEEQEWEKKLEEDSYARNPALLARYANELEVNGAGGKEKLRYPYITLTSSSVIPIPYATKFYPLSK